MAFGCVYIAHVKTVREGQVSDSNHRDAVWWSVYVHTGVSHIFCLLPSSVRAWTGIGTVA